MEEAKFLLNPELEMGNSEFKEGNHLPREINGCCRKPYRRGFECQTGIHKPRLTRKPKKGPIKFKPSNWEE